MKKRKISARFVIFLILGILWLAPLLLIFPTSFESPVSSLEWPITPYVQEFSLAAYENIFNNPQIEIWQWYYNSLFVSTITTVLSVIIYSMAGFAFAKLDFKYRDKIFIGIMLTMMIPAIMNLVPLYLVVDSLGLIGSKWAMIFPALASAFNVFLMRQFFISVPDELLESAYIDGAGYYKIFTRVMLPSVKPALVVVAINSFIGSWNEYLWASIVTNDISERTLPVGLAVAKSSYGGDFAIQLALVIVTILPTIILYFVFQKYLLDGVNLSAGIK